MCSTPRGITAPGHRSWTPRECVEVRRAQRLAASPPRVTLRLGHGAKPRLKSCSTPRGITAPGHPARGGPRRGRDGGAQRLAASPPRVTRLRRWATETARPEGAQRLAASPPRVTRPRREDPHPHRRVLNASRHHRPGSQSTRHASSGNVERCSTPRGITAPGHDRAKSEVNRAIRCSTPRGITAPGHERATPWSRSARGCSTPRGITAPGHEHARPSPSLIVERAQRLAASPPRVTGSRR